jgi:MoaA/NifB/PqqE/SkfB family radical SAM enzyme
LCNLTCAHCYSSSSPHTRTTLETSVVLAAIEDAAELGYRTVSVSGGEPLLYSALPKVLDFSRRLGLRTTVTTNGTVLDPQRLDPVAGLVDLLAISVDGDALIHDRLRGRPGAFGRLTRGLEHVRERGLSFGFIHTLTRESWEQIEAIVELAAAAGAQLVQIHPLELAGRAAEQLRGAQCDQLTLAQVYILTLALNLRHAGRPLVQYDVVHARTLHEAPDRFYASDWDRGEVRAEDLAILVLEADGTVVPITYGFGRAYAVADVNRERLRDGWRRFEAGGYGPFRELCRSVHDRLAAGERRFVNWYEVVHDASLSPAPLAGAAAADRFYQLC